jgi:hypothetical protein
MSAPKFQFYEVVRVLSNSPELAEIHGETGAILGMTEDGEPDFEYGVFIEPNESVWSVAESNLESTGIIKQRADFYDDTQVIHVQVDSEGRGTIAD